MIQRKTGRWSVQHGTGLACWLDATGARRLHPKSRDGLLFDYAQALEIALDAVESVVSSGQTFDQHWRARHHDPRRRGVLVLLEGEPVLMH